MNVLDLLRSKNIEPKRAGSTHGGEYHSPCPACGGNDRFHVWPEQNEGSGSYWCRGCGKGGDNIQFLIDFDGMTYPEACASLEVEPARSKPFRSPELPRKPNVRSAASESRKNINSTSFSFSPPRLWTEKAEKLVSWAHENLLRNRPQLEWLKARGIEKPAIEKYRLGWIPEDMWRPRSSWGLEKQINEKTGKPKTIWFPEGLVIPKRNDNCPIRVRIRRPQGEPRYYLIPGSSMEMMTAAGPGRAVIIVESELDLIMIDAVAGDTTGAVALGSSSAKPDATAFDLIRKAAVVLNAIDYDDAGAKAVLWWTQNFPNARRWPVPVGKDPGDAFKSGIDIREWITLGLPKAWVSGPSLLESKKPEGEMDEKVEYRKSGQTPEGSEAERGGDLPASVAELIELIRQYPVEILNRSNRLKLIENKDWARKNWEIAQRISRLVYFDPDVFEYLANHPDEKISGDNIENNIDSGVLINEK